MTRINETGQISDLENVTSRPNCDFRLTLIHCSYRLECVGLPFKNCHFLHWGEIDEEKVKWNGKNVVSTQVSSFSVQAIWQKWVFQKVIAFRAHKPCRWSSSYPFVQGRLHEGIGMTVQGTSMQCGCCCFPALYWCLFAPDCSDGCWLPSVQMEDGDSPVNSAQVILSIMKMQKEIIFIMCFVTKCNAKTEKKMFFYEKNKSRYTSYESVMWYGEDVQGNSLIWSLPVSGKRIVCDNYTLPLEW